MTETTDRVTCADALLRRYAAGERDFRGASLRGADLPCADLRGADLRGADLPCADLTCASLTAANLTGANLRGANLRDANLTCAHLYAADLTAADLTGAELTCAHLYSADLTDADLTNAELYAAELYAAHLTDADLTNANDIPTDSHDAIAELLRQAAGMHYDRRQVAGLVLVSRDWCWSEFTRIGRAHWSLDLRRWIVETLTAAGPQFAEEFAAHPLLTKEEMAAALLLSGM